MKRFLLPLAALALVSCAGSNVVMSASNKPAKELFGAATTPSAQSPEVFGGYSRGCLAGAEELPETGPTWQAMRLSRNRNWGHPALISFVKRLSAKAATLPGWAGLYVGDMSQPRGGPMLTGHVSHQIGLDAEAASDPAVARILVFPGAKVWMCERATGDRSWLRKIRPWHGHHYHFHVRLACPAGSPHCKDQAPPPPGDGCADARKWVADILDPPPPPPPDPDAKPRPPRGPLTLKDLPRQCASVLR